MSNFDSILSECFGFSQIITSQLSRVLIALVLMSPRLPIGVETIYRPFFIILFILFFILLPSCAPVNNISNDTTKTTNDIAKQNLPNEELKKNKINTLTKDNKKIDGNNPVLDSLIQKNVTIILSEEDNADIVKQFINIVELSVYQKKLQNISFEIKIYKDKEELDKILKNKDLSGKLFIGPINSKDTKLVGGLCDKGAFFFSFSSKKDLAKDCVYLVNFFPENEIKTIFKFFPKNSKVALLYPENEYGFNINKIIDEIANTSESIIVNRASYSEDLSNAPLAIKELGKYDLRKYELNRQKKILATKKDAQSKKD